MENPEYMQQTSLWPILIAVGLVLIVVGIIFSLIVSLVGVLVLLGSIGGWVQENRIITAYLMSHEEETDEPVDEQEVVHE